MAEQYIWLAIVVGVAIAAFLVRFCLRTWKSLQRIEAAKQEYEKEVAEKKESTVTSVRVIAQCMIDEQVELSEGCIRVKILLDHLAPQLHDDERFSIFVKMYDALEHMPTHEARKQTDKRVIFKLDQERFKLEDDNQDEILNASRALLEYSF